MHIVLLILKILLIAVLVIVGLVIVLALLVLLVPVRYKAYVRKLDDIWAKLTARWLGFVLCFKVTYDQTDGLAYKLRLFGGTLLSSDSTESRGVKENRNLADIGPSPVGGDDGFADEFPSAAYDDREFLLKDDEFLEKPEGIFRRLGQKIDSIGRMIVEQFKNLSEKFAGLKKKKDGYTKLMNNVRTKEAIRVVKGQLIVLLKHLKPTRLKGQIVYGAGDPADTGQHLGYMSVLFPLYYDHIDITPDFSEKRLEGDIMIKGRIRLWTVGWCVLKVIWNKNVKITISRYKKISGGS